MTRQQFNDNLQQILMNSALPFVITVAGFFVTMWKTNEQNTEALKALSEAVGKLTTRVETIDLQGTQFGRGKLEMLQNTDQQLALQQGKVDGKLDAMRESLSNLRTDVAVISNFVQRLEREKQPRN